MRSVLEGLGFDPVHFLVNLLPTLTPDWQAKTALALLPYVYVPAQPEQAEGAQVHSQQVVVHLSTAQLLQAAATSAHQEEAVLIEQA